MAFLNRRGGLTPPGFLTFVVSLVLAMVAIGTLYMRVPYVGTFVSTHRVWVLAAAYAILALGVLLPGL